MCCTVQYTVQYGRFSACGTDRSYWGVHNAKQTSIYNHAASPRGGRGVGGGGLQCKTESERIGDTAVEKPTDLRVSGRRTRSGTHLIHRSDILADGEEEEEERGGLCVQCEGKTIGSIRIFILT